MELEWALKGILRGDLSQFNGWCNAHSDPLESQWSDTYDLPRDVSPPLHIHDGPAFMDLTTDEELSLPDDDDGIISVVASDHQHPQQPKWFTNFKKNHKTTLGLEPLNYESDEDSYG